MWWRGNAEHERQSVRLPIELRAGPVYSAADATIKAAVRLSSRRARRATGLAERTATLHVNPIDAHPHALSLVSSSRLHWRSCYTSNLAANVRSIAQHQDRGAYGQARRSSTTALGLRDPRARACLAPEAAVARESRRRTRASGTGCSRRACAAGECWHSGAPRVPADRESWPSAAPRVPANREGWPAPASAGRRTDASDASVSSHVRSCRPRRSGAGHLAAG